MPIKAQRGVGGIVPNYSHPNIRRRCSASRCGCLTAGEQPMPNPKFCLILCQNEFIPVKAMKMFGGVEVELTNS